MTVIPLRLGPGDDLRLALQAWMTQQEEQAGRLRWREWWDPQPAAGSDLQAPHLTKAAGAGFGATDQANGRPFQVQPRPLRVRHTDTGPIAATTRPPAPISHQ